MFFFSQFLPLYFPKTISPVSDRLAFLFSTHSFSNSTKWTEIIWRKRCIGLNFKNTGWTCELLFFFPSVVTSHQCKFNKRLSLRKERWKPMVDGNVILFAKNNRRCKIQFLSQSLLSVLPPFTHVHSTLLALSIRKNKNKEKLLSWNAYFISMAVISSQWADQSLRKKRTGLSPSSPQWPSCFALPRSFHRTGLL